MADDILDGIIAMLRAGELSLRDEPAKARPLFDAMFSELPLPEGMRAEPGELGGVPGLWLRPEGAVGDRVIVYLHGGAYVIGSANTYKAIAAGLTRESSIDTFLPDYRLAPEHPYPAAPEDVLAVYRALLDQPDRQVIIAGDSAGGGLVMSLLLDARAQALPQPACAVMWSPWLDLHFRHDSINSNAASDPTLDEAGLRNALHYYLGDTVPADERLNPLASDLAGLAPMLVQVGSIEILRDDALALASRAAACHTYCQVEVWPGMPHVWHGFAPMLAEGSRALAHCSHFIDSFCGRQ